MNSFSRAREFAKLSFGVIKKDKELLLFPLFSSIFSLIFTASLLFPTIIVQIMAAIETSSDVVAVFGALEYLIVFIYYLGISFIATYFNVCVVYTAKIRFSGKNATFGESLKFSLSKIHLIFLWSMLSATVGLVMYLLDNLAQSLGKGGEILVGILRSVLGMLWSIMTIFVVPAMVYYDLTPFKAIKKSNETLKKTWGESIIRHYGLGLIKFLFVLLGVIVAVGLGFLFAELGGNAFLIIAGVFLVYLIIVLLVFQVAENVFNTALFVYADKGKAPSGISAGTLKQAMKMR
ncbi:MAG: DUF6159 family protein [Promethearchaeota archaeon]